MLFNSFSFLIFLPIVFGAYWFVRERKAQNVLLLVASYVFYGWWDWRFLALIVFMSAWTYFTALWTKTRVAVVSAVVVNLGILCVFKYLNFFLDSLNALLPASYFQFSTLRILLPVGISFYTFKLVSYSIDVYRGTIKPTRDIVAFFTYVGFFPQLLAGPIERAKDFLPQLLVARRFDYPLAVEGCRQMLWGFFKKVAVSDTCAVIANAILGAEDPSSISLVVGVIAYTFQIYADFSGYSDIAIGCSKLLGFRLARNFACPYFSRNVAEFWRRWHMTLMSWFRDYLYIPLGGGRCGLVKKIRNTFVVFLISGLWHGANWTFVLWGLFHALCFLPFMLLGGNRKMAMTSVPEERLIPRLGDIVRMGITFVVIAFGWLLFRAQSLSEAWGWICRIVSFDLHVTDTHLGMAHAMVLPVLIMLGWEWLSRGRELIWLPTNRMLRWCVYYLLFVLIVYWQSAQQQFVYFKF